VLDVIKAPHPILGKVMPAFDWQRPIRDPRELVRDMAETMLAAKALGLAAPQVGIETRCFVMRTGANDRSWAALFNPVITEADKVTTMADEGCLSLPGEVYKVARPRRITLIWENEEGETRGAYFEQYAAHVVAHELDHLKGITLHQVITPAARALAMRRQNLGRRVG